MRRAAQAPQAEKNFLLAAELGVLLTEAVDTTSGVDKTLLASIEGVAVGTNFDVNGFTLSRKGFRLEATSARHFCLVDCRMDIVFHGVPR